MMDLPQYLRGTAMGRDMLLRSGFDGAAAPRHPALTQPIDTADKLKAARKQLGLSQADLGAELRISGAYIGQLETGKAIDRRTDLAVRALLAAQIHGGE